MTYLLDTNTCIGWLRQNQPQPLRLEKKQRGRVPAPSAGDGKKDHTMRTLPILVFLFGIVFLEATTAGQKDKSPQEAAPIIAVLKAIKESDVKAFRKAYCERIREDKDQGDWEKNLKEAQGNLKKLYGNYELKEFAFTFAGDADKGKVSITYKGKKSVALAVIKEDGAWKINER